MKIKRILICLLTALVFLGNAVLLFNTPVKAEEGYQKLGDSVFISTKVGDVMVTPHTLVSSGWVRVDFQSKSITGDIDISFGFNGTQEVKVIEYRDVGSKENAKIKDENIYLGVIGNATDESLDYKGAKKWRNVKYSNPINKNTWYSAEFWVEIPFNGINKVEGKYNVAVKPNGLTLQQAISQNKIVVLDPWYDSAWGYRKLLTVTGSASGAQTDYAIKLNAYYGAGADVTTLAKEPSSGMYTAGATTNSTRIVCSSLTSTVDDYYNGCTIYNYTRDQAGAGTGAVGFGTVTDYVGATKTITCTTIAGQTFGNLFYIFRTPSFYTDSKCQTDFDDIRFTKSDGITLLDYWLEYKVNSSYATYWVELDSIPASPTTNTFYVYYGNSSASYTGNGTNTFPTFDDFERGNNGDAVGGVWTAWVASATISTDHNNTVFTSGAVAGTRSCKIAGDAVAFNTGMFAAFGAANANNSYHWDVWKENLGAFGCYVGDGTKRVSTYVDAAEDIFYYNAAGAGVDTTYNLIPDTWQPFVYNKLNFNVYTYNAISNSRTIEIPQMRTIGGTVFTFIEQGAPGVGNDFYVDNFIIRKYCFPEPTISAWGAVETTGSTANTLIVSNAKVFSSYINSGDWLITCLYTNLYEPYYSNGSSVSEYFYLQLYDGANVVAQTRCAAWGYKPGSIYMSAAMVAPLTWGTAYQVRLYGNFTGNPTASYTLTASDWKGTDLSLLDTWSRSATVLLEDYYGTTLSAYVSGKGLCLNDEGGVVFTTGCPTLDKVRPNLFQTVAGTAEYTEGTFTHAYQSDLVWQTALGSTLTGIFTNLGNMFSLSGAIVGMVLAFLFYAVIVAVAFTPGNAIAAIIIPLPIMLAAWYVGVIALVVMGVVCALASVLLIWYTWFRNA